MAKEEKKEKAPAKPAKEKVAKTAEPKAEAKKETKAAAPQKEDKGNNVNTVTLKKEYNERIVPALMKEFGYKSVMQAPKLQKIVINQGLGMGVADKKIIETAINELTAITGQRAVATHSKKDISNFKLRKKMTIGARVTLRHDKMYEFLERLVRVALPRIRDFRGIESKLDGRGNYTLGIQEQIIFPEINIDSISRLLGMNITFVTSAETDEEGYALLREFGLPFKSEQKNQ
ncbi:MAG: 50S ribosomal protein L5 [Bacteroidia bacterium]|nr:50S ribosomal protein L5 [Bacteroidia bacterium]